VSRKPGNSSRWSSDVRAANRPPQCARAALRHFTIVKPWGTPPGNTYAYSSTITPTIAPSAIECQNTYRKIEPSFPT
jgi:hypothetical protein